MQIEVDSSAWHERERRHPQHLLPGDQLIAGTEGPGGLMEVWVRRDWPATTYVTIADPALERMVADHELAREIAARGYTCIHEGSGGVGPEHGTRREVPPRRVSRKGLHQLLADHLVVAVLPAHCDAEDVTAVRIVEAATLGEPERLRIERYLMDTLTLMRPPR